MREAPPIAPQAGAGQSGGMTRRQKTRGQLSYSRMLLVLVGLLILSATPSCALGEPSPAAVSAFNSYIGAVDSRLAQRHRSQNTFLAPGASASQNQTRLLHGEFIVEQLTPAGGADLPGAMLHHWRGTAFVAGATAADFERLMKNFNAYPQYFSPQVLQASLLTQQNDHFQASMRVRQKHVITVVMDTAYDITFGQLDAHHGYSTSRSTRISEIDSPGTSDERVLSSNEEHGFLWRQNTYWSYEERDGGLYMQSSRSRSHAPFHADLAGRFSRL
jgi:hypothetical protein